MSLPGIGVMAEQASVGAAQPGAQGAVETYEFDRDGGIPNSVMPLVIYRRALAPDGDLAHAFEETFAAHRWTNSWRDGSFEFHHFHSNAHEVLGVARGQARVRFGGPNGKTLELGPGDVAILPAGTGHRREHASADLLVIGAYPDGADYDIRRGDLAEFAEVSANVRQVPLPREDPIDGKSGRLFTLWRHADLGPG
jgi:uncharacterized protein YjlB